MLRCNNCSRKMKLYLNKCLVQYDIEAEENIFFFNFRYVSFCLSFFFLGSVLIFAIYICAGFRLNELLFSTRILSFFVFVWRQLKLNSFCVKMKRKNLVRHWKFETKVPGWKAKLSWQTKQAGGWCWNIHKSFHKIFVHSLVKIDFVSLIRNSSLLIFFLQKCL